jgi:hypothetical protein
MGIAGLRALFWHPGWRLRREHGSWRASRHGRDLNARTMRELTGLMASCDKADKASAVSWTGLPKASAARSSPTG